MGGRRQLIVVANRGPVSYARDADGARVARRGGGGLVTALRSLVEHHDVTWIASAMTDEDRVVAEEHGGEAYDETARDGSPYRMRLVAHEPSAYDWYYNVVANPTLWFLQHSMWALAYSPDLDLGLHNAWFNGYLPVNESFARATLSELGREPQAAVFFHDYHLYLAPKLVREQRPDALLAHFIHIPWPQSDYWYVLPEHLRRAVHEGVLANDIVGFHTDRWRRNFLRCCEDMLDCEVDVEASTVTCAGRRTIVTAHPLGVDPAEFDELRDDPRVLEEERLIVERRPEQLVLRVDRTDPSKNVVRGFRAFALFLDMHPEFQGRVTLLALLDPSRQDIPEYSEYLAAIQREARAVNDRFQHEGWVPIDLQVGDNFAQSVGVQAVRRPAGERRLRRPEPRLQGGAPRQRARRRAHPLREHRCARGARRLGDLRQSVRPVRASAGDPRRADDGHVRAAAADRGAARLRAGARRRSLDRRAAG